MNVMFREKVYGKIPEDYKDMLLKACNYEPEQAMRKKTRPAVILVCCIILFACTAFAVAQRSKIAELFGIGSVNQEEVMSEVEVAIAQKGGDTQHARFTVSEAFYDGNYLRFVVDCIPDYNAVLLDGRFISYEEPKEISGLDGTRYGVLASARVSSTNEPIDVFARRNGSELLLYANVFLPEKESPEELDVELEIDILSLKDGAVIDETGLSFIVHRTSTPLTREFDVNVSTELVSIKKVSVTKSSLETLVSVEYEPLLKVFAGFVVVPEDGYIARDGTGYTYGSRSNVNRRTDETPSRQYTMPVEQSESPVLTLWINGSDAAIQIDTRTGEVVMSAVEVITDDLGTEVKIMED